MRRPFPPIAAAGLVAAGLLVAHAAGGGSATRLSAKLTARAEQPAPTGAAAATGLFTATLSGTSLAWRLGFSKLTGKAVAAHIHIGRPGVAGPVAVPLCGPCAAGAHGTARLDARTKTAILAGRAYVNVHTARNAAGEIRGQILTGVGSAIVRPTTRDAGGAPPTTTGGYGY